MSRKPRFALPGVPQHVIQRGHNREPCFYAPNDYRRYGEYLREAAQNNEAHIHAYVLMTNHVHLLVTPGNPHTVSHMMQDLGRKFVRYINRTYRRTGSLWEGRFRASLVDSEAYLLTCMRYIELNPVRAGMVARPGDYPWSSYPANANGRPDCLLTCHPLYERLGNTADARQHAYRELFRLRLGDAEVDDVRQALNQELVLGRPDFKDRIEAMLERRTRPGKPGRPAVKEARSIYYVM